MVRLSAFWFFNVRTDVDACEADWKLPLGEKSLNPQGLEPASVVPLAFQSDTLPAELSPPHKGILGSRAHNYNYLNTITNDLYIHNFTYHYIISEHVF